MVKVGDFAYIMSPPIMKMANTCLISYLMYS